MKPGTLTPAFICGRSHHLVIMACSSLISGMVSQPLDKSLGAYKAAAGFGAKDLVSVLCLRA